MPSMLTLIVDSMSREWFYKAMPKTMRVLRQLGGREPLSTLHAELDFNEHGRSETAFRRDSEQPNPVRRVRHEFFDFERYQVLGYSTKQNIMPLVSGADWRAGEPRRDADYVWRVLGDLGYVTMMSDGDCPRISGYAKVLTARTDLMRLMRELAGGRDTDFEQLLADITPWDYGLRLGNGLCSVLDLFNERGFYDVWHDTCLGGGKYLEDVQLNMATELWRKYPHTPKFGLVHMYSAHEHTQLRVATVDERIAQFVLDFVAEHPNTMISLLADHGFNYGQLYKDYESVRRLHTLPGSFLLVPSAMIDRWQREPGFENARADLERNQLRLVTHYDLYETFRMAPLLGTGAMSHARRHSAAHPRRVEQIGVPLMQAVSAERTCDEARIPLEYCACNQWTEQGADAPHVRALADACIAHANSAHAGVAGSTTCLPVRLSAVDNAFSYRNGTESTWKLRYRSATTPDIGDDAIWSCIVAENQAAAAAAHSIHYIARLDAYSRFEVCHDERVPPEYCVCNVNDRSKHHVPHQHLQ
jgi:Protein of unknown function (DUF229)